MIYNDQETRCTSGRVHWAAAVVISTLAKYHAILLY